MEWVSLIAGVTGAVVALLTLALVMVRGALTSERRITALETKVDLFWNAARMMVADTLQGRGPNNPINEDRWAYLLNKFRSNELTNTEADELHAAFLAREQQARIDKDMTTLLIVGLGLALLAILLSSQK